MPKLSTLRKCGGKALKTFKGLVKKGPSSPSVDETEMSDPNQTRFEAAVVLMLGFAENGFEYILTEWREAVEFETKLFGTVQSEQTSRQGILNVEESKRMEILKDYRYALKYECPQCGWTGFDAYTNCSMKGCSAPSYH